MKKFLLSSIAIAACLLSLSCKNNGGNSKDSGTEEPAAEAFVLPEVDDVCSQMDDPSFKAFCLKNFDADSDGKFSMAEAAAVTELLLPSPFASEERESEWEYDQPLFSLKGVEYFQNLKALVFEYHKVTSLDVSKNTKLEHLYCSSNEIVNLDVSNNPLLKELSCSSCGLTSLDVSKNTELVNLSCNDNQIPVLDVSKNTKLTDLACTTNQIKTLDISNAPGLEHLHCGSNLLTSLDVSKNPELVIFFCEGNQLTSLDVSKNPKLEWLLCKRNNIKSLDLSNNTKLSLADVDEGTERIGFNR